MPDLIGPAATWILTTGAWWVAGALVVALICVAVAKLWRR